MKKESIKQFLYRFNEVMVQIPQPNEGMFVEAFIRELRGGTFGESLVQRRPKDMAAIKIRAASHIKAEEFTVKKKGEEKRDEGANMGIRHAENRGEPLKRTRREDR